MSRWQGRKLKLTSPGGAAYETSIIHSDAARLYFAPIAEAVGPGWSYQIVEMLIGGVYRRTEENGWELATGSDTRGASFHDNPTENLPERLVRFGRFMARDYINRELINDIWRAIDKLRWTAHPYAWTSREDPDVPEDNRKYSVLGDGFADGGNTDGLGSRRRWQPCGRASRPMPRAISIPNRPARPGKPRATTLGNTTSYPSTTDGRYSLLTVQFDARYAYGRAQNIPRLLASSAIDFYAYASRINGGDDTSTTTTGTEYGLPTTYITDAVFDDFGAGLPNRLWKKIHTDGSGAATVQTPRIGSIDYSHWPAWTAPPAFGDGTNWAKSQGLDYAVTNWTAIIRWDVYGGMEFVT